MPYIGNPSAQRFTSPRAASVFSGDGSTVAFTLEEAVSTDEDILVSVDGVIQEPSVAYSVSNGTTLTFTAAPSSNSGNNIFVYYIARTFGSVSMPDGQNVNAATLSTSGNVVFNEASADVDFRVESNGDANMINVDGGNDVLGIKTATPTNYYADDIVLTAPDEGGMTMVSGTSERAYLAFADGTSGDARYRGYISYDHNTDQLILGAGGSGRLLIDGNGIITKAAQVSFSAKASGSQTNIAVGSTVDVVLATEHFDRNADFASNVFTVPSGEGGKYVFSYCVFGDDSDDADTFSAYIEVDGTANQDSNSGLASPRSSQNMILRAVTIITLTAGQVVEVVAKHQGTNQSEVVRSSGSFFSGYKLIGV